MSAVPLHLDRNVLLFTMGVSLLCAIVCGLIPAGKTSRADVNTNLKDEGRGASPSRSQSRLRTLLVMGEIAAALFLLVGSGLLFRSIYLIEHQNLGFRADPLLTAGVNLDTARYKDTVQQSHFVESLLSRLQSIPTAEAVAITSDLPSTGPGTVTLQIKGQPDLPADQRLTARHTVISPGYFQAAGIALLRGRTFTDMDNASAPRVVVVNQEFVRRHLHDQEPFGRQIRLDAGANPEWSEIVGVVNNVKFYSEAMNDDPEVYEPFLQRPGASFALMVRSSSDPGALASALRGAVAQLDAELPLSRLMTMSAVIESQRSGDSFFSRMLGSFATLALLLAAIGIYGLIAYSVGQRTHEIGIRMAMGAGSKDVLRMVLWEGLKTTAVGGTIGLAISLPLPRLFDAMFFGLNVREPWLYVVVPMVLLAVAMLATYIPARRAIRVDPLSALRYE